MRTLDSGVTVRSPNCDLRGSSVTCASHGGTAKRLARMLQRSLDPACNGFCTGLASPSSDTVDTVTVRCSLTDGTVNTGRRYGRGRFRRQIGCPNLVRASSGYRRGRGRTSREQSREEQPSFLFTPYPPSQISGRDSAGARPFPCRVLFLCGPQPCETALSYQSVDRRYCSPLARGLPQPEKATNTTKSNEV